MIICNLLWENRKLQVKTGNLTGSGRVVTLAADDFLPLFVWVLVKTRFVTAEIEAEYMWGIYFNMIIS